MNKWHFLPLVLTLWAIAASSGDADGAMDIGTISGIDSRAGTIIVDDQLHYLTATTQVERDDGRTASIADLVRGQSIGLDVVVEEGRHLVVKRVRILLD